MHRNIFTSIAQIPTRIHCVVDSSIITPMNGTDRRKFHIKVSWKIKPIMTRKDGKRMLTYNGENAYEHSQLISSYGDVSDVYSICRSGEMLFLL